MNSIKTYVCSNCGNVHGEWPALAFDAPTGYSILQENKKKEIGELSGDFCIVLHADQTDRFIRCTLTLQVNDHCDDLDYGVWVSLSESSYQDYAENYNNHDHEASYFGWLCNDIPQYEIADIPTTVFTRKNGIRPEIVPHKDFDHQLVRDYFEGITKAEAEKRIQDMIAAVNINAQNTGKTKPWWKFW